LVLFFFERKKAKKEEKVWTITSPASGA